MRFLIALILLAAGSARAGVNTEGLPAGAVALVAFDLAAFRSTKIGQATEKVAQFKGKNLGTTRKLNDQLGIDTTQGLREFIVAVYPGPDGKVAEKNATGIVLIRGRFEPATINAFGQSNQLPAKTIGRHQAWEAGPFIEKVTGEKPKDDTKDAYVVAHSAELILVASGALLERAIASADRGEKAGLLPPAAATKFGAVRNGWLFVYADATQMKDPGKQAGLADFTLALGENATDLQLVTAANFLTPEKAALTRNQLTGLQAMASIGLMNDDGKSDEEKANMALLAELVQKIRLGGEGKTVTLELDFPAAPLAKALSKAIEKNLQAPAPAAK